MDVYAEALKAITIDLKGDLKGSCATTDGMADFFANKLVGKTWLLPCANCLPLSGMLRGMCRVQRRRVRWIVITVINVLILFEIVSRINIA